MPGLGSRLRLSWGKPTPADKKNFSLKILEFCCLGQLVACIFCFLTEAGMNVIFMLASFSEIATRIGLKFPVVILSSSKLFISQKVSCEDACKQ